MRVVSVAIFAAFSLTTIGCDGGSADAEPIGDPGPRESRTFSADDFTSVLSAGPDRVIIRQGDQFAVTASGRRALLDRLSISVDGATLQIRRQGNINWNDGERLGTAVITVTMPSLRAVTLAGSGEVQAERLEGDDAELVLAGSGDLQVRDGNVGAVDITLAGSGDMELTGRARSANVTVAGSGSVSGATFGAATADINIAGSGDVALQVSDTAEVSIIGSGDVNVTGGARCTVSRRGSGEVNCRN